MSVLPRIFLYVSNLRWLLLFLLLFHKGSAVAQPSSLWQDQKFFIFLCIGGSNMVGQGDISSADCLVSDRFRNLPATDGRDGRRKGVWRRAVPPLCRTDSRLSVIDYFGQTMLANLPNDYKVGVVVVALENAPVQLFDRDNVKACVDTIQSEQLKAEVNALGGNPYQRLLEMARQAQKDGIIRGVLYHQGENDAYDDNWLRTVRRIYNNLLADLVLDSRKVPLIVGEVGRTQMGGAFSKANDVIDRLPDFIPNAFVASSASCHVHSDGLHFNSEGYRSMGRELAVKMLQMNFGFNINNITNHEVTVTLPEMSEFDVDATIDDVGVVQVDATMPLNRMEILNDSGHLVVMVPMSGASHATIDTRQYCTDRRFTLVFYNEKGESISFDKITVEFK